MINFDWCVAGAKSRRSHRADCLGDRAHSWCDANHKLRAHKSWSMVKSVFETGPEHNAAVSLLFKPSFSGTPNSFESLRFSRYLRRFLCHWQLDSSLYSRWVTDFSFPREFCCRRFWEKRYRPPSSSMRRVSKYRPQEEGSLQAPGVFPSVRFCTSWNQLFFDSRQRGGGRGERARDEKEIELSLHENSCRKHH